MGRVTTELAGPERRETLDNLFQFYVHDFADFLAPERQVDLKEDGRFGRYPPLDAYWRDPDHEVRLIRVDGALAGFALTNADSHSGLPLDYAIADFFVVRRHRRAGVGFVAATEVIRARPGLWEMAVARRNTGALPFWRRVAAAVGPQAVEEVDRQDDLWDGPIVRVRVP
jgi:predicted acetyltransferase